jgi:hypothetical protein
MLLRAAVVWLGIVLLASVNGAVRDLLLTPRMGDTLGRAISTIVLSGLVLLVTWYMLPWVGPRARVDAVRIGVLWVALTLMFEFGAGHYLFRKPWSVLLEDYDLRRGRIWIIVLIVTFAAPIWVARFRSPRPR